MWISKARVTDLKERAWKEAAKRDEITLLADDLKLKLSIAMRENADLRQDVVRLAGDARSITYDALVGKAWRYANTTSLPVTERDAFLRGFLQGYVCSGAIVEHPERSDSEETSQ